MKVSRATHWVKLLLGNLGRARTLGLATQLAFWIFLSLLPIAAVAGLVVARIATRNDAATAGILSTMPAAVRDMLTQELSRVSAWNEGAVAPVAAATFVWLASSGVAAIFDALEAETEADPRPWWKKRGLAILTCVGLSIGVALITVLTAGLALLQKFAGQLVPAFERIQHGAPRVIVLVVRGLFSFVIATAMITGLFAVGFPPRARRRMPLVPGAAVSVVLMATLGFGYGVWVARMGDSGAYQAGLAVIGVTLMFLWLTSIALLVGAEVNQLLGARRLLESSVHPDVAPPPPTSRAMRRCDDPAREEQGHLRPSLSR